MSPAYDSVTTPITLTLTLTRHWIKKDHSYQLPIGQSLVSDCWYKRAGASYFASMRMVSTLING